MTSAGRFSGGSPVRRFGAISTMSRLGVATLSTHGVNPAVYKKLPYDADKGFTPVAELVKAPVVLIVSSALPAQFGIQIRKEIDRMRRTSRFANIEVD